MQKEFPTRKVKLPVRGPAQLTGWLVSPGDTVRKGSILCKYQLTAGDGGEATMSLKAPCVGIVKQLLVQQSVALQPGYVLLLQCIIFVVTLRGSLGVLL